MFSIEIEIWDTVFGQAIAIASKTAWTKDIVVSHFLKLLDEAKLFLWVILCWQADVFLVQLLDSATSAEYSLWCYTSATWADFCVCTRSSPQIVKCRSTIHNFNFTYKSCGLGQAKPWVGALARPEVWEGQSHLKPSRPELLWCHGKWSVNNMTTAIGWRWLSSLVYSLTGISYISFPTNLSRGLIWACDSLWQLVWG